MITWEVVPVVGGALGAVALSETSVVSVQIAGAMVVLLAGWLSAHSLDSNEWVKRNLFIISNIERQFLNASDSKQIHYYFSRPHKIDVLRHFQIQLFMSGVIATASVIWVVISACSDRQFPGVFAIVLSLVVVALIALRKRTDDRLKEFIKNSPGSEIG
jgi:hypothetical protein